MKDWLGESYKLLPDDNILEDSLSKIFSLKFGKPQDVRIIERVANNYTSRHPSEIIRCSSQSFQDLNLFLKYEIVDKANVNRHWKNLYFESSIYTKVLSSIAMSTPEYYGFDSFSDGKVSLIVLEYIKDLVRFQLSDDANVIFKASRWLGEFHKKSVKLINSEDMTFIPVYDSNYFLDWVKKTKQVIIDANQQKKFNWLMELCEKFKSHLNLLTGEDRVIIHGEFYPQNVYYANRTLYPIDWQTAAISIGEIDLAALLENWPEEMIKKCYKEYLMANGSKGPTTTFYKRYTLARVYLCLLWICSFPTIIKQKSWVMNSLKKLGPELDQF